MRPAGCYWLVVAGCAFPCFPLLASFITVAGMQAFAFLHQTNIAICWLLLAAAGFCLLAIAGCRSPLPLQQKNNAICRLLMAAPGWLLLAAPFLAFSRFPLLASLLTIAGMRARAHLHTSPALIFKIR